MEDRTALISSYIENVDRIIRRGSDISFESIEAEINILLNFFKIYYSSRIIQKHFTENDRQDIENYVFKPFSSSVTSILDTTSWGGGKETRYEQTILQSYVRALQQKYITTAEAAQLALDNESEFQKEFQAKADKLIKQQELSIENSKATSGKLLGDIQDKLKEVETLTESIQKVSTKAQKSFAKQIGSSDGKQFLIDSDDYRKTAGKWLNVAIFVALIPAGFIAWLVLAIVKEPRYLLDNPGLATFKLAVIAFSVYLLQVCLRNYSTNKHLQVINKQRATILAFVNTFVASVDSDIYKDYLLTYAAKTVFDHGETGFISKNYGAGNNDNSGLDELLNLIRKQ